MTRPNVLFILTDDQPAHTLKAMPKTLAAFRAGVNLTESAYVAVPLCGPARASIFTGLFPHNHGIFTNTSPSSWAKYLSFDYPERDLFHLMAEAGYDIAFTGKVENGYVEAGKTWIHPAIRGERDLWVAMTGEEQLDKFEVNYNGELIKPGIPPTKYFANQATKFLNSPERTERPWFCYVPLHDPHAPYIPIDSSAYDGAVHSSPATQESDLSDKSAYSWAWPKGTSEGAQSAYEGTMEELVTVDRRVAGLIDTLRESGQLENTIVIFSSDNGFLMGEHGGMTGKASPYEESARIPFLIMGPGIPSSVDTTPLVSHVDIPVTILDAANNRPDWMEGRSLLSYFRNPSIWRKKLLVEMPSLGWYMLREGPLAYFQLPGEERELYDLESDPYQLESLHRDPEREAVMVDLQGKLDTLRQSNNGFSQL